MKKRVVAILLAVMLLTAGVCSAAAEDALHLQNVVFQDDGTVDLVVAVPGTENLQPADFTVVANKEVITAESVSSMSRSDVVTHWIIVLDLSMSERFKNAQNTVMELIKLLPEKDQIAVMTPGMTASELQWTNNKEVLTNQVSGMKWNKAASALNAAVADAVTMLENQSSVFDRACLVIVSNGENSDVTGMTQNELVTAIANSHVAVYTYAFKDSEPVSSKINSYGAYARAGAGGAEIIVEYRENDAVANAKKVEQNEIQFRVIKVPNANLPAEVSSFTVSFQEGTLVLADEYQLTTVRQLAFEKWLKVHRAELETTAPVPTEVPAPTEDTTVIPAEEPEVETLALDWLEENLLYVLGGVLVVLLALLVLLKRKKPASEDAVIEVDVKPEESDETDDGEVTVVDTDSLKLLVKFTRTNDGSVHSMTMNNEMTVGRDKNKVDLVLTGDDKVSRVHARICLVKGAIVLENLSETNGTYVNGKKIDRPVQLHQQDVLKMGEKYYQISWSMQ